MRLRSHRARAGVPGLFLDVVRAAYPATHARQIEDAYQFAARAHHGQRRRSGDPYITHPLTVATLAVELHMRPAVICAALLHDVLDATTPCAAEDLRARFGSEVADLVIGVTRLEQDLRILHVPSSDAASVPQSADVVVIKVLDRLHNLRTIRCLPLSTQYAKARQTLQVVAPAAQALGMDATSTELHQLAEAVLRPTTHQPPTTSAGILGASTILLPAPARTRWQQEWTAELNALPTRRARAGFVLQTLRGIPHLAATLRRLDVSH